MDEEESHDSTPFVVTIPSLKIPHKRARIGFRWGVGNELAFFVTPSQPKNQPTAQKLQVYAEVNQSISHMFENCIFQEKTCPVGW
jgi:hypothetical protein